MRFIIKLAMLAIAMCACSLAGPRLLFSLRRADFDLKYDFITDELDKHVHQATERHLKTLMAQAGAVQERDSDLLEELGCSSSEPFTWRLDSPGNAPACKSLRKQKSRLESRLLVAEAQMAAVERRRKGS